ncbi:MAG: DUF4435 domain-containing protein [Bacteroidales bacterium]|jgi:hypothetical protein|nr:DUF4435 domain-containing protein [Bacteroidales bacterium]
MIFYWMSDMKRPLYHKERFYQQMAENIKGQARMLRFDCAAHLEANEDEYFWGRLFKKYAPDKRILYMTYSKSPQGNHTTGVGHCLNFSNYLDEHFIICIDSDYRRLEGRPNIDIAHFIFQTYTYSFENHHCVPEGLDEVILRVCGKENHEVDFFSLIDRYSRALYEPFIWHLYFQEIDDTIFSQLELRTMLSLFSGHTTTDVGDYVEKELRRLEQRAKSKVKSLREEYPDVDLKPLKERYKTIGLLPERTFLFIRGHNIFDSLCRLGRDICINLLIIEKKELSSKKEISDLFDSTYSIKRGLVDNLRYSSYPEINWIEDDIKLFFQNKESVSNQSKRKKR